jgi:hypothetical protein
LQPTAATLPPAAGPRSAFRGYPRLLTQRDYALLAEESPRRCCALGKLPYSAAVEALIAGCDLDFAHRTTVFAAKTRAEALQLTPKSPETLERAKGFEPSTFSMGS